MSQSVVRATSDGANATKWTVAAAATEVAATGLALFVRPSLFAWLVFGADFSEAGNALGRLTAFALLGLALAAWPTSGPASLLASVRALVIYNLLAAIYLLYVGVGGQLTGVLLWPAVALHAGLSVLLGRTWLGVKIAGEKTFRSTTG